MSAIMCSWLLRSRIKTTQWSWQNTFWSHDQCMFRFLIHFHFHFIFGFLTENVLWKENRLVLSKINQLIAVSKKWLDPFFWKVTTRILSTYHCCCVSLLGRKCWSTWTCYRSTVSEICKLSEQALWITSTYTSGEKQAMFYFGGKNQPFV